MDARNQVVMSQVMLPHQANVAGNLVKLWRTYPAEQVESIANSDLRNLEKDLQARLKRLSG